MIGLGRCIRTDSNSKILEIKQSILYIECDHDVYKTLQKRLNERGAENKCDEVDGGLQEMNIVNGTSTQKLIHRGTGKDRTTENHRTSSSPPRSKYRYARIHGKYNLDMADNLNRKREQLLEDSSFHLQKNEILLARSV